MYHDLGLVYLDQRKSAEAMSMFRRAHEVWDAVHGHNHIKTATAINNIGNVYAPFDLHVWASTT